MHGGSRLTVNLPYQETTGPDFRAYALEMKWWADGSDQMPAGSHLGGALRELPGRPATGRRVRCAKRPSSTCRGGTRRT